MPRYQSYQRACTTRGCGKTWNRAWPWTSVWIIVITPEWRENRETKPEVRSSKVDKRNGALCTQREHALARRRKEYVINSVKGEKKRDKTAKKSRRMLRFISLHPWWCHCIASHFTHCERYQIATGIEFSLRGGKTSNFTSFQGANFDHRLRFDSISFEIQDFNSQFINEYLKKMCLEWKAFGDSWFSLVINCERLALGLSR